jgi:hypothetical protein
MRFHDSCLRSFIFNNRGRVHAGRTDLPGKLDPIGWWHSDIKKNGMKLLRP